MKHYIFGYGSLINLVSLGRTIGRPVDVDELKPACLRNYQRFWGLVETVFSEELAKPVRAVFLDIRPDSDSQCNGVIISVTDVEFSALLVRERNYDCLDVTDKLTDPPTDGRVKVFAGRNEHQIATPTSECYVMQRYIGLLHTGVDSLGIDFANRFWTDTVSHNYPILDGAYSFL